MATQSKIWEYDRMIQDAIGCVQIELSLNEGNGLHPENLDHWEVLKQRSETLAETIKRALLK